MAEPVRLFSLDDDELEYATGVRGPAPYPLNDGADATKYASYNRALFDEQRQAMEPLFLTWTQNLLFLAGHQWWQYDPLTGTFQPPKVPVWKERPVRNLLKPYFKHVMAKATKARPVSACVPASSDPEDIHAAELGDDVLKAKWRELNMSSMFKKWVAWVIATGNGYVMPYWNTDSGILQPLTRLVEATKYDADTQAPVDTEIMECPCDENGEPLLDEEGNYDLEAEPAFIDIGEVAFKVLSPFQVFVDAGATCHEDVRYILIAEPLALREIRQRWPDAPEIHAEDTSELDMYNHMVSGLASGADTHMVASEVARDKDIPKAIVLHYYERPTKQFSEGRSWTTCAQELLEAPGPLPDGIWPVVVPLGDIEVPGRYHWESTMTAAIGLQREYNESCGQIKEHHNLMLRGKWLVPIGSNIRRGQITTQPGEVIQHTPGLPPVMADLKQLPPKVYEERQKVMQDFEFVTGIFRISMGQPPPGVTSGRAFLTLQEADDTDMGPLLDNIENAVAELSWLTIQIIQRYYEEERLMRVAGENNRYRVRAFKGADLNSIVDVEPQAGSAFPWSMVAKQSMMIDLIQVMPQLFTDPETGALDHDRIRRMLPVGGMEAVGMGSDLDVAEALREEEVFEVWDGQSELPQPLPWQDHRVHLRQHARLLKSMSFQKWDPENKAMMIEHWGLTQAILMEMQAAAMEAEAEAEAEESTPSPREEPKQAIGEGE